jgi:DNA topoisomerase I
VRGSTEKLKFRGKGAHLFDITIQDPDLARLVRRCQHLPGQRLFEYRDPNGKVRRVGSSDVNAYISEHGATGATAKTFRTWEGSTLAAEGLAKLADDSKPTQVSVRSVIGDVAAMLGNTPTVCRASYVHPVVIDRYLDGSLSTSWSKPAPTKPSGLAASERRLLRLLTTS